MGSIADMPTGASSDIHRVTEFFIHIATECLRKVVGVANGIQVSIISISLIVTGWADEINHRKGKETAIKRNVIYITPEQTASVIAYELDKQQ